MAGNVMVARPEQRALKPAFTVKKLDGKRTRNLITFGAKGDKIVKPVEVDAGYLVKMRNGHSIRVETDEELKRLGFDQTIPVMDDEGTTMMLMQNDIVSSDDDTDTPRDE